MENITNTSLAFNLNPAMPQYKSKSLNTATSAIYEAARTVFLTQEEQYKRVCVVLARVERNKAYKDDGFNSLAEYVADLGMNKSKAHKMENAGRLLTSDNETVRKFAEGADYSKLAMLASEDESDVAKAIEDGALTQSMTQSEVSDWKKSIAKDKPAKVLKNYHVVGTIYTLKGSKSFEYESIALEAVPELDGFDLVKRPVPETITEYYDTFMIGFCEDNGDMVRVSAAKVKAPAKPKKSKAVFDISKLTDEQLAEIVAAYAKRRAANEDGD